MAENRVVPVIGVPDVEGSITRDLVAALHLMDLRIRSLNLIFPVRDSGLLLEAKAAANWGEDNINQTRDGILQAIFIPNQPLNNNYYLRSLEGMTMTFLDPTSSKIQGSGSKGIIGEDPQSLVESARTVLDWGSEPIHQYRIAIGRPHRLVQPDRESNPISVNLVLMQITSIDKPSKIINEFRLIKGVNSEDVTFVESSVVLKYNNIDTSFSLFSLPGLRDGDADIQNQIKTNFAADEQTRLLAQWKEILSQINNEEVGDRTYLPVVISDFAGGESAATDFVLKFASIGFSISLLDLGVFYKKYSGSDVDVTGGSSKMAQEHARGDAFDLSLVPYYAISGMILKSHTPFILSQQFNPHKHPHQIFKAFPQITDANKLSAYSSPIIKVVRQPSAIQENSSKAEDKEFVKANQNEIKLLIKGILSVSKVENGSEEIFSFDDLSADDQHWYHQSVESVQVLPTTLVSGEGAESKSPVSRNF